MDFDADGKADFVGARYTLSTSTDPVTESVYCSVRRSLELYRNTTPPGSSAVTFSLTFAEPYTYVSGGDEPRFADLDGDGLPELIGDSHGGGYGFRRNLGQGVFGPYVLFPGSIPEWSDTVGGFIVSSDETGRLHILARAAGTRLWQGAVTPTSSSFTMTGLVADLSTWCARAGFRCGERGQYFMADVNGDGLTDALMTANSATAGTDLSVYVAINTGNGFADPMAWTVNGQPTAQLLLLPQNVTVSDYDGDGKDDLVARTIGICDGSGCAMSGRRWVVRPGVLGELSAAELVNTVGDSYLGGGSAFDFNGDGLLDFYVKGHLPGEEGIYVRNGIRPDLLQTVTDGFGAFD